MSRHKSSLTSLTIAVEPNYFSFSCKALKMKEWLEILKKLIQKESNDKNEKE